MFLTIVLLVAAICDAHTGKIPNWLIACGVALGGALSIWNEGLMGLFLYLGRFLLVLASFYLIYCTGTLGAGDVKLFSVIVAYLGLNMSSVWVIWSSFFFSLLMATFAVVADGNVMSLKKVMHTPVRLAPAIFIGWIIYLGGIHIG